MEELETLVIKMRCGFKTDKFGMLAKSHVYELPKEDAEGLLRYNRAEMSAAKPKEDLETLIQRGSHKSLHLLKTKLKKKKILTDLNAKTDKDKDEARDAAEALSFIIKEQQERMDLQDQQIAELRASKRKDSVTVEDVISENPEVNEPETTPVLDDGIPVITKQRRRRRTKK